MIINIFQKNGSTQTATIETSNSIIPRIGETIIAEQDIGHLQEQKELLVFDVQYILKDNQLTPVVSCIARSGAINRVEILQEHGWLQSL